MSAGQWFGNLTSPVRLFGWLVALAILSSFGGDSDAERRPVAHGHHASPRSTQGP